MSKKKANKGESTYKNWLLNSGYPYENDILILINEIFPYSKIKRNLEFICENEKGQQTIRSIDFVVRINKPSKNIPTDDFRRGESEKVELMLLIDAKYSNSDKIMFIPSSIEKTNRTLPALIPKLKEGYDGRKLNVYRKDFLELLELKEYIPRAEIGRKVSEVNNERNSVTSNVFQIFQGLTSVISNLYGLIGTSSSNDRSYYRNTHIFIPIIVTNAPLIMVKDTVTVSSVEDSVNESDVSSYVHKVVLDYPNYFDVKKGWRDLKQKVISHNYRGLGWAEEGMESENILFCETEGLKDFLKELKIVFDNLKESL